MDDSDSEAFHDLLAKFNAVSSVVATISTKSPGKSVNAELSDDEDDLAHLNSLIEQLESRTFDGVTQEDVSVAKIFPKMDPTEATKHQKEIDESASKAMKLEALLMREDAAEWEGDNEETLVIKCEVGDSRGGGGDPAGMDDATQVLPYCGPCGVSDTNAKPVGYIPAEYWGNNCSESARKPEKAKLDSFSSNTNRSIGDNGLKQYVYDTRLMEMQVITL